jgi:hypothetical protein
MALIDCASGGGKLERWCVVFFFRSQAFFPPAVSHCTLSTDWWNGFGGVWEWRGWAGEAEEARNTIAGGDGMAGPRFEENHPNHSNSYVDFSVFSQFSVMITMTLGGDG